MGNTSRGIVSLRSLLRLSTVAALGALHVTSGCGSSSDSTFDGGASDGSVGDGASSGDSALPDGFSFGDSSAADGGCQAPDMLVVLDRTLSMSAEPNGTMPPNTPAGHALSKWVLATSAVKLITNPPADQTIRYGLELFPLDPAQVDAGAGNGKCVTLTQELGTTHANNKACQPGQLLFPPAVGNGAAIAATLDPEVETLCVTTPIASALDTARSVLAPLASPTRKQFVLLVTDGGETCSGNASIGIAQQLAASGVQTFVVGFGAAGAGGGVNVPLLNNVACAGMTAKGFATACVKGDGGGYIAAAPNGAPLFLAAQDGPALEAALKGIAGSICCGCAR